MVVRRKIRLQNAHFKFRIVFFKNSAQIHISIPTPDGGIMGIKKDEVNEKLPSVIGIEIFDSHKLIFDNLGV